MLFRPPHGRTRLSALYRLMAALAVVAQCVLVLSAIGEGRAGVGQAAHVESSGNSTTHYVHDEATCAACQARTLLAVPLRADGPDAPPAPAVMSRAGAPSFVPAAPALPGNPTRAPPSAT